MAIIYKILVVIIISTISASCTNKNIEVDEENLKICAEKKYNGTYQINLIRKCEDQYGPMKWGKANLDSTKEFITIIPEKHINDIEFVEYEIIKNRKYSIEHRDEILSYARTFDWVNIIQNFYLPNVDEVLKL